MSKFLGFALPFIFTCVPVKPLPTKMITPSVQEYFPEISGDLTKVTWAHAVNNQSFLKLNLADPDIMMLEADVSLGHVNGDATLVPIMAHPPATESDLSLQYFLESVIDAQENRKVGVKLDFKTTEVFNISWTVLDKLITKLDFPVWLNADILQGPIESNSTPVNSHIFLKESSEKLPATTLSLGWTTRYDSTLHGNYTKEQLDSMREVIKTHNTQQPITLAVRAGIIAETKDGIIKLVDDINRIQNGNMTTITVWMSNDSDPVDVPKLRDLILSLNKSRVFLDVPEFLRKELNLNSGAKSPVNAAQGVIVAFVTSITTVMSRVFRLF